MAAISPSWPRAHGTPIGEAILRRVPEDFAVTEQLSPPSIEAAPGGTRAGQSEHLWLWIEKRGQNTAWVGRMLAEHFGVRVRDVAWSGLKDRHAVTRQWFSVWLPGGEKRGVEAPTEMAGWRVLAQQWASQKIRRGMHQGNRFSILLRDWHPQAAQLNERLNGIARLGAPNYFGAQRFGYEFDTRPQPVTWASDRQLRGLQISAMRSYLFNRLLGARVEDNTWCQASEGDWLGWRGSRAGFVVTRLDQRLQALLDQGELSPTAWLPGRVDDNRLGPAERECEQIGLYQVWVDQLIERRVQAGRRACVVKPEDMTWEQEPEGVRLAMTLPPGAFATTVLAELCVINDVARADARPETV